MTEAQDVKQRFIEEFAARHGIGTGAVQTLLRAIAAGGGSMAQFSHSELGGMGQWSRGGMIMVGDMFNQGLKYRVDTLCTEISDALMENPALAAEEHPRPSVIGGGLSSAGAWWPKEFGSPSSSGAQNDLRYAFFPGSRRLVVEKSGFQAIYDTGEHMISGVSQQQGGDQSLNFSSQLGAVRLADLVQIDSAARNASAFDGRPLNESPGERAPTTAMYPDPAPAQQFARAPNSPAAAYVPDEHGADGIFAMIKRLADLRTKGILSEEEFAAKKTELLARL